MIIEQGASFSNAHSRVDIGGRSSGDGTVIVRDPGSTFTTTFLRIGRDGEGSLVVEDGAIAHTTSVWADIGGNSSGKGEVLITGAGSQWHVAGDGLFLGGSPTSAGGTGSLSIGPGALVNVDDTFKIWEGNGNVLSYILAGPQSMVDYGHLDVGGLFDLGNDGTAGTLEILPDD